MTAAGVAAALSTSLAGCDANRTPGLLPGSDATGGVGGPGGGPADPGGGPTDPPISSLPPLQNGAPTVPSPTGPPPSVITRLPGQGSLVALTIDDGVDSAVVAAYCELAQQTGLRLTFFVTAVYPSWTENASLLRPLVDSGQIQLGNHTWSHPSLAASPTSKVVDEITRCEKFLNNTFGVTGRPFLRPPYGAYNANSRAVAASLGYTATTMWEGSFADSSLLSETDLIAMARRWLLAQHIVIGHANYPTVTHCYGQILDLIRERSLQTVTLDDVFFPGGTRQRQASADPNYPADKLKPSGSTQPPGGSGGSGMPRTTPTKPIRT